MRTFNQLTDKQQSAVIRYQLTELLFQLGMIIPDDPDLPEELQPFLPDILRLIRKQVLPSTEEYWRNIDNDLWQLMEDNIQFARAMLALATDKAKVMLYLESGDQTVHLNSVMDYESGDIK